MGPSHPETASGLIQDCLMSESNNRSLQRAQPPLKTSRFVCLFVFGSDEMSTLQQPTMQEMDGVCVCGKETNFRHIPVP